MTRLFAYASGYGPRIYVYAVDLATGALTLRSTAEAFGASPSYLAVDRAATRLYAVDEAAPGRIGTYAIDAASGALTLLGVTSSGGDGPCYVGLDGGERFALVANYGNGTVGVLPLRHDGTLGEPASRHVGDKAHMIATDPSNRFVLVPCLGIDAVVQLVFDAASGALAPNAVPRVDATPGAGPRHVALHPSSPFAYVVNELRSTVTAYAFDTGAGTLAAVQTEALLPDEFRGRSSAAGIAVHPSGAWLLASNRGHDSLVVFAIDASSGRLTLARRTGAAGRTPRAFAIDPTGAWVFVANQGSSQVVPFRFDARTPTIAPAATAVDVPNASCVALATLPEVT